MMYVQYDSPKVHVVGEAPVAEGALINRVWEELDSDYITARAGLARYMERYGFEAAKRLLGLFGAVSLPGVKDLAKLIKVLGD